MRDSTYSNEVEASRSGRRPSDDQFNGRLGDASGVHASGGSMAGRRGLARRPVPPKLYRIGEVVEYSGVSRQTIHNYTTMGLLRECRWTDGGHRLYDESVFWRLDEIAELKARRRSLEDIREHFAWLDGKRDTSRADHGAGGNGH